ncbi:hypothetical protein OIU84_015747 [Salix udensis]|uniref:Uncharacterized protein n=1 Tax=Salix udensis TaxID=889485 RepID=A0AAD6J8A9_9ROSI|nr:hypothetical protein OIU84_015747 [Salix udensis]
MICNKYEEPICLSKIKLRNYIKFALDEIRYTM